MQETIKFELPTEVLKNLSRRSDSAGLIQLCGHLAMLLMAGIGMHYLQAGLGFAPLLLVYGVILTFLFAPLHETIHFTAFKTRWLNNLVAAPAGFLLLIPFQYFRAFHYGHHRHTQNPQLDPELLNRSPLTSSGYWLHVSGLPFWWGNLKNIYHHARGQVNESFIESGKHNVIINEARYHLFGYVFLLVMSLLLSSDVLWWYWLLPSLIGQPFLRLFLLAEHSGCDLGNNMLENSRTTYTSPLVNFLAWNMPYHAEHHYLASIPFHALPALHAWTGQQVKFKGEGYCRVNLGIVDQLE